MSYKQVIVVRKDLNMSPGKLAVQVGHAVIGAIMAINNEPYEQWAHEWWQNGEEQRKIVLQVKDELALYKFIDRIKDLPHFVVYDRGYTELEAGTLTCVGLAPMPADVVDPYTKRLRLYN